MDYFNNEGRYKSLEIQFPEQAKELFKKAEEDAKWRLGELKHLKDDVPKAKVEPPKKPTTPPPQSEK